MGSPKKIFAIDVYASADGSVNLALKMMDAVWLRKKSEASLCRPKLSKKAATKTLARGRDWTEG